MHKKIMRYEKIMSKFTELLERKYGSIAEFGRIFAAPMRATKFLVALFFRFWSNKKPAGGSAAGGLGGRS